MPQRVSIAIDMGRRRLRVLVAQPHGGSLRVRGSVCERVPPDLDRADPEAVGRWIGRCLETHDVPRGAVTVALAREHVGLKRIRLPSTDLDELPSMTRLAMARELPFDADGAVIDFVPGVSDETSTSVLAVAVPPDILDFTRRMMSAAGLNIERIGLRAMGAAALISGNGRSHGGTMLVDVTGEGAEFCVVDEGDVIFSRSAETTKSEDAVEIAESVVTEARRTWLSYRIVEDSSEIVRAVVIGDPVVAGSAAAPIGEMLKLPADVLDEHGLVDASAVDMDGLWPLAGLLLEATMGRRTIDFQHPRRSPDVAARTRRRALIGVGLAVVALLASWTVGSVGLDRLERELDGLRTARQRIEPEYVRHIRSSYRLTHLRHWESARIDWLRHAAALAEMTPSPDAVVLDSWTATSDFAGVRYDRREKTFQAPAELSIVLSGEARDRATADGFRETLVETDGYAASSTSADTEGGNRLPFGFTYRLRATVPVPAASSEASGP